MTLQREADRLEITYFTDPLCCWSWAFEPHWRRLLYEFEGSLTWQYCMSGLLPSWNNFNDPANSVTKPIQMGPVWMHASQLSGMPVHSRIWMENPPASSYPACIAVKCATLQSLDAGEKYLRRLREAVMLRGENIAKTFVLESIAENFGRMHAGTFDVAKFRDDLYNDNGLEAFRRDMERVQLCGISRYPSLLLRYPGKSPILITGYRPYSVLLDAIKQIAPGLQKVKDAADAVDYAGYWESITDTEIREAAIKL